MNNSLYNSVLYVNLEQLRWNVRTLLGELKGKELVPVLKGNAYGLGLERIGRELAAFDEIHTLAVAQVSEGAALRRAGVEKDILVLGGVPERLLAPAAEEVPEPADEKPSYQRDDIARRLDSSEEFRLLTAEVEKKLGKKLTTPDVGVLLGLTDYLGLPADVIYLLVGHCMERIARKYGEGRRPTLRQIEREGYAWARMGVDTQKAAVEYLKKYTERQGAIPQYMRVLGLGDRLPVASEEKYLNAWQEMGFPPETVALAYDKTVMKCHELKWPYCNGILKRWHQSGLHTPEEVQQADKPQAKPQPQASGDAWKYV